MIINTIVTRGLTRLIHPPDVNRVKFSFRFLFLIIRLPVMHIGQRVKREKGDRTCVSHRIVVSVLY